MARRGKYPPRVKQHWHLLQLMQKLIDDQQLRPFTASKLVADDYWGKGKLPFKSKPSFAAWLRDNQRKFWRDLRGSPDDDRLLIDQAQLLRQENLIPDISFWPDTVPDAPPWAQRWLDTPVPLEEEQEEQPKPMLRPVSGSRK